MYLPTRYATKITAASISLIAFSCFFSFSVQSQEPTQTKPAAPATPAQDKPVMAAPAQTPLAGKEAGY